MDPDDLDKLWKQDIPFEEKAKLYYEQVDHIVDDKGGYRPILTEEYRKDTLRYFKDDGTFEIFDDYTIDTNRVVERKDGGKSPTPYEQNGYLSINVRKNKKQYSRSLARAMLSTFLGPPPDLTFTADHIISEHKLDDDLSNLRWLDPSGQANNQNRPETLRSARIIVNELFPDDELTAKEWTELLTKPDGTKYSRITILEWARTRENGFSYKTYEKIDVEEWKIYGDPDKNHVAISNKNRVKDVTVSESGHKEEHVRTADQLCLWGGYPSKKIDGVKHRVHILVFQLWYPDLWANRKPDDMVLHKHDNRLDFRPKNLYLGTGSKNVTDSYDNGKRDGTKSARQACIAYKNDEIIEEFESLSDAARYLEEHNTYLTFNAAINSIRRTLKKNKNKEYKGFTWKSAGSI
ncbi:hypothetical protein AR158_C203R [Paramecium bursaria Chlorella virus AR158]|uniref:hypothetical protein n=1 Tax=Paramecium bursaria Chlorella virus AR158 TaxID=380598 RepID=UPI00015AA859|nr:hypothetical protein AR158_C203R [Paramecium bursaria Chlorella virus AR158]ABU43749.1 hypothetical protein AR158_C203R [Paramecium bursaria Chlorella virus AR158]